MPTAAPLRIALCQIDTIPGDIPGNLERIEAAALQAAESAADLAVFPELAVVGYSPRDLLFRRGFLEAAERALRKLADLSHGIPLLVGTVAANEGPGRPLHNAAVLLEAGEERARIAKSLLPDYDVFDEARYFEPAHATEPIAFRGHRLGVTICEDIWVRGGASNEMPRYVSDPARILRQAGATIILNLSASPYHVGKPRGQREELIRWTAERLACPVAVCNLVAGNDEIIFDGSSLAADAEGRVIARAASFREEVLVFGSGDAGETTPPAAPDPVEELRDALVLGIRDYAAKCGFREAVIGLSGGIDSAVTAALTVDALGAAAVTGVAMPARFSSLDSVVDARDLAERLGMRFFEVSIDDAYAEMVLRASTVVGEAPFGVMEENIQARLRGVLLMAVSNRSGALLVTTGNKSELAVGYCTLYGDMCGGLAAISDVWKTDVYRLGRWYQDRGRMPPRTMTKPPSAELRPDQTDQDSLPPYDLLDRILRLHVEEHLSGRDIVDQLPDADAALVRDILRRVAGNEYKRNQAAPGLRVSPKAFGWGRRIPVVASHLDFLNQVEALP